MQWNVLHELTTLPFLNVSIYTNKIKGMDKGTSTTDISIRKETMVYIKIGTSILSSNLHSHWYLDWSDFETTHHHRKQFAHNCHLLCCQCTEICSHVSSIKKWYEIVISILCSNLQVPWYLGWSGIFKAGFKCSLYTMGIANAAYRCHSISYAKITPNEALPISMSYDAIQELL